MNELRDRLRALMGDYESFFGVMEALPITHALLVALDEHAKLAAAIHEHSSSRPIRASAAEVSA